MPHDCEVTCARTCSGGSRSCSPQLIAIRASSSSTCNTASRRIWRRSAVEFTSSRSEAEFRLALAAPLGALAAALAWRAAPWIGVLILAAAFVLVLQGLGRSRESNDALIEALRLNRAESPSLERLDKLITDLPDLVTDKGWPRGGGGVSHTQSRSSWLSTTSIAVVSTRDASSPAFWPTTRCLPLDTRPGAASAGPSARTLGETATWCVPGGRSAALARCGPWCAPRPAS